tara:strand:- start:7730 stop:8449 length:720 start_codon:yes stop_codon:yes gene_type:complete
MSTSIAIQQTPSAQVRQAPRMSINSLAKYWDTSSPLKRLTILRGQKFPKDYIVSWYKDSMDPISDFLTDPNHDTSIITGAISVIRAKPALNDHQESVKDVNVQALRLFLSGIQNFPLGDYDFQRKDNQAPHSTINGLSISVRPEFELIYRGTGNRLGALKLYFSKSDPLSVDAGAMVAMVVKQHTERHNATQERVNHRHCFVIDVFANNIHVGPQATAQRRNSLTAACDEIVARWPSIT